MSASLSVLQRSRPPSEGNFIGVLDIGSAKISCVIADVSQTPSRIVGYGQTASQGLRSGTITDMDALADAVGIAVHTAEQMAGETLPSVFVAFGGGEPFSRYLSLGTRLNGAAASDRDIQQFYADAMDSPWPDGFMGVHTLPLSYTLDGQKGIRDPRDMYGESLELTLHQVGMKETALRNLSTCVGRCHLEISGFVSPAYAAGLTCLAADEMELGALLIDIGHTTTNLALFTEGKLVHVDMFPLGGFHVTQDIARGLTTSFAAAERIKILHGHAVPNASDDREMISHPLVGDDHPSHHASTHRGTVVRITQSRVEEILEIVKKRLAAAGFSSGILQRVVLTGGTSQLPGLKDVAQRILERPVRLGRPSNAPLPETLGGPQFSVVIGLLNYATQHRARDAYGMLSGGLSNGIFRRFGTWLRGLF